MHVTVPHKSLSDALRSMKRSVPNLTSVRLTATSAGLTLSATDFDSAASLPLAGNVVTKKGQVDVAFTALAAVKAKAADVMEIRREKANVIVVAGGLTHTIPVFEGANSAWDRGPYGRLRSSFDVDLAVLHSVLPAASGDPMRPILTGVYFAPNGDLVATDSYRLHLVRNAHTSSEAILVPSIPLLGMAARLKSGTVRFDVYDREAWISAADGSCWSVRLIEGDFPNYEQLLPKQKGVGGITFPRPAFVETLRAMDKLVGKQQGSVKISQVEDRLQVEAVGGNTPSVAHLPGNSPVAIGFTPAFLAEAIHDLSTCTIRVIDALKPGWVEEDDEAGRTHFRLLMPTRVS